jgi:hypothetical protein
MMIRLLVAALISLASPAAAETSPLVGAWNKDGAAYAELRADGFGQIGGQGMAWKADARTLTLFFLNGTVERMTWKIAGKTLTVVMNGRTYVYSRPGSKPDASKAAGVKDSAGKDQLSKLLVSSAWCAFTYNKVSGASHQERVVFRADGTWGSGARGETYSSGVNGAVSGQSGSSSGGRWRAAGSSLLMSQGRGALADTNLSVSRNSNGYPILNAGGKEYSSCK